jgi:LysR family hydrogen peroxide-inducible transcriptional activator
MLRFPTKQHGFLGSGIVCGSSGSSLFQAFQASTNVAEHSGSLSACAGNAASIAMLKHMVASGLGITVLPKSAANITTYGERALEIRPFADPAPRRTIALAWRVSYPRPQAIDTLANAMKS